jgi:hypothetical protein
LPARLRATTFGAMGVFILALALAAIVLVLIGVFSRSATRETWREPQAVSLRLAPAQLHELARAIVQSRSLRIDSEEVRGDTGSELVASDPTPVVGGRVFVRTLPGPTPVRTAEVQGALAQARAEGYGKVLLIAPSGFSDEARLAGEDSTIELVDGARLIEVCRGAVDMGALSEGRVVPRVETTLRAHQAQIAGTPADSHP